MRTSPSSESERATNIIVMIVCVALIPFLITRHDFLPFTQITYILLAASFSPWIVWWMKASKLFPNELSKSPRKSITLMQFMLVICVVCNSFLLWLIFMYSVCFEIFPFEEYGLRTFLAALAPFTIGAILMLRVARQSSKLNKIHVREALLLWLGLILPILSVLVVPFVIYVHGTLLLYVWFFAQALGYGVAFYGLRMLDAQPAKTNL